MPQNSRQLWQRIGLRCLIVAAVIPLIAMGMPMCWYLFGPFVLAMLIAVCLQKPIRWLERRLKMKRWIAVTLMLVLLYLVLALFIYWFTSFAVTQAISALESAPDAIDRLTRLYRQFREWLNAQFDSGFNLQRLDDWIGQGLTQLTNWASQLAGNLLSDTFTTARGLPTLLLFANFMILGSYFITRDYPKLSERYLKLLPDSSTGRIKASALEAVNGYLRMQLLYAFIVLVGSATVLSIFGVPYGFVISCVAALLEFLPVFGNGTLYVPLIIILYLAHETRYATIILVVHLFFYIGRKVTEPRLMKHQMGLSPIMSLLTMYVGMQMGGVLGLTLAPILSVVALAAIRDGVLNNTLADFRDGLRWIRQKLKRES